MSRISLKTICTPQRIVALVGLVLLITAGHVGRTAAQAVSVGYNTDQQLQRGMIVQFKAGDTSKIEAVSQNTIDKTHGVVVDPNDAPVTLSGDSKKVFVATTGHYAVLVNTQNGPIAKGDYITISAISGIGMKAGSTQQVVVGRALAAFDGASGVISSTTLTDSGGGKQSITLGRIDVDINVARNPLLKSDEPNLPEFLQRASEAIAGKKVNPVRVYIALVVFIVSTLVAIVLLYGGVRSAITSIGRNPLSKKSIIRGMIQVIIVGLTIFITGIFGVYLLLKL